MTQLSNGRESIDCPYCGHGESSVWGSENGFDAVQCASCAFVYVNPRPIAGLIDQAVTTGTHSDEANSLEQNSPLQARPCRFI
jgi:Zn ribbon nucleic-acid-binding protein